MTCCASGAEALARLEIDLMFNAIADGTPAAIAAAAGVRSLEEAFVALTGTRDAAEVTHELLDALER